MDDLTDTPNTDQIEEKMDIMDTSTNSTGLLDDDNKLIFGDDPPAHAISFECTFKDISKLEDNDNVNDKKKMFSPVFIVQTLPWQLMTLYDEKFIGVFLRCNHYDRSPCWSCYAKAELKLLPKSTNTNNVEPVSYTIRHTFCSSADDWGYSKFIDTKTAFENYVEDDSMSFKIILRASVPYGISWNSKKYTGYVGLKNQGATCYMNSLLQALYFTNPLRKAIYQIPTECDQDNSIALALQRIFYDLQFDETSVSTKKLTNSFGWNEEQSFMQHDVQEFLRILLENIETKIKDTQIEGSVRQLFQGRMVTSIKCKNVDFVSMNMETFYDIQLNVKGYNNIYESFNNYIATEILEGDNKYNAGEYGLQEAQKSVHFTELPPVLHLHLMRFEYNTTENHSSKCNDRFEFFNKINLHNYLDNMENDPIESEYILHAVLAHSGNTFNGHYVVYINPLLDGKWYKFDDEIVSICHEFDEIELMYGGNERFDFFWNTKCDSNAYMLIYIKQTAMHNILEVVEQTEIPSEIIDRIKIQRHLDQCNLDKWITVKVIREEFLESNNTLDLFDIQEVHDQSLHKFKFKLDDTILDLTEMFSKTFHVSDGRMRIWSILSNLYNDICRPKFIEHTNDTKIIDLVDSKNNWIIFLQLVMPDSSLNILPIFNPEEEVLIFFIFYDSLKKNISYCGSTWVSLKKNAYDLVPLMNELVNLPPTTELTLHLITDRYNTYTIGCNDNFAKIVCNTYHGQVVLFEKTLNDNHENNLIPYCNYYKHKMDQIDVLFFNRCIKNDSGFIINMSKHSNYEQIAVAVGNQIDVNPLYLQFFVCKKNSDEPGSPLPFDCSKTLADYSTWKKKPTKLFYFILNTMINELQIIPLSFFWLSINTNHEKQLYLFEKKGDSLKDLLISARKFVDFNETIGSGKLRLIVILDHKIVETVQPTLSIDLLKELPKQFLYRSVIYRIEEIPKDEIHLDEDERLIPVFHYEKNMNRGAFGHPFYIKVNFNERFEKLKIRIQKKLNLMSKEIEKYQFYIVIGNDVKQYLDNNNDVLIIDHFKSNSYIGKWKQPYLAISHSNTNRRSLPHFYESSLKIYN